MVYLYAMNLAKLPGVEEIGFSDLVNTLDTTRQQKIEKLKQPDKKKQTLGAGLLLKFVLEDRGFRVEKVQIGPHGKPEIEGMCFNLSHSGDVAICVVSDLPVGCDIEKIRQMPECFGEDFFRVWTMKESYGKMTGEGLNIPKNVLEVRLGNGPKIFRNGIEQECVFKEYDIPGYQVYVCAQEAVFSDLAWVDCIYKS